MYHKIVKIYHVARYYVEGVKDWDRLHTQVTQCRNLTPIRENEKFVVLDKGTAEKYSLESDLELTEFYNKMDYYDSLELGTDVLKNCVIVEYDTIKEKNIPELLLIAAYGDVSSAYKCFDESYN